MQIQDLNSDIVKNLNEKGKANFNRLEQLLTALRSKDLSDATVQAIQTEISNLNSLSNLGKHPHRKFQQAYQAIVKRVEKDHKLVTKNYYKNLWMSLGMAAFGIPLGVALGSSLGNMAFLGIGLPIGMAIGISLGTVMDKKAEKEGRQLNIS